MEKDLLKLFKEFNDMPDSEKIQILTTMHTMVDNLAHGVWNHGNNWKQCAFCCRSPESEHMSWCSVTLAREFKEKYLS